MYTCLCVHKRVNAAANGMHLMMNPDLKHIVSHHLMDFLYVKGMHYSLCFLLL